jgi:hypothetical protein
MAANAAIARTTQQALQVIDLRLANIENKLGIPPDEGSLSDQYQGLTGALTSMHEQAQRHEANCKAMEARLAKANEELEKTRRLYGEALAKLKTTNKA